ncbi:MAG: hypothetical protein EPN64_13170 [Burkholderiaceae bacterium]|nr:MAG: hypothetical protein EPN64_13170 [Burkholderiaceae bacterium]
MASWPGLRHEQAAERLLETVVEPCFGELSTAHVQLVPQNFGVLGEDLADRLVAEFPASKFRLHANVRVLPDRRIADLSGFGLHRDWFQQASQISRRLGATAYTGHSGSRSEASLNEMLDNARRCADLFGCVVGVEGQYPVAGDKLLVSSWGEYQQVFESGVPYAIDLSHLNILATASHRKEVTLVMEMLSCERCIEVHVSDNDGSGDWHQVCESENWWHALLSSINPDAVVFSEGNHRKKRNVL